VKYPLEPAANSHDQLLALYDLSLNNDYHGR
jgi:hypothetical protein